MWDFIRPVNLIRYLVIWRVNSSLVHLPRCLSTALSQVMGTMIANRLPTQHVRAWHKALEVWNADSRPPTTHGRPVLDAAWPIEAVLFAYPGKRTYGQGEVILWELKLLANSADHGLFLELIVPAMEEAASTADPRWHRPRSLWGRFDIHAVYAARGADWEPVVSDGRLDVRYRLSPTQWAEGLTFGLDFDRRYRRLTWITPVDLGEESEEGPTLQGILNALMDRMTLFLPGKHRGERAKDVWAVLSPEEQTAISLALEEAKPLAPRRRALKPAPREWPGRWIGTQTFTTIPQPLLPYLELASILHIGRHTHFGCGTFTLT